MVVVKDKVIFTHSHLSLSPSPRLSHALRLELGHFELTTAPNLITALSKGREPALSSAKGYGEAGGEGLFSAGTSSESVTHRFASPANLLTTVLSPEGAS